MFDEAKLNELEAALQPLVDAAPHHPCLPRLFAAVKALRGPRNHTGNGKESPATLRALEAIAAGTPAAQAARENGLAASTVFRALKRRRESST